MEDNNNNLGDFFRKRLSSSEGGDEDWFNPNPRTDDLVLQGLMASSKGKKNRKALLFILLPCVLFLGMLGYIVHLKQHITLLDNTITKGIAKNISSAPNLKTVNESKTTLTNNIVTKENKKPLEKTTDSIGPKDKNQLPSNRNLEIENQTLQNLIAQKDETIQALQLELSQRCQPTNSLEEIAENGNVTTSNYWFPSLNIQPSINESQTAFGSNYLFSQDKFNEYSDLVAPLELGNQEFRDLPVLEPRPLIIPTEELITPIVDYTFSLKKNKKRRQNSFEVGVHLGIQNLLTSEEIELLNQRIVGKTLFVGDLYTPTIGLSIAYSPIKNLWIRTGGQVGGNRNFVGSEIAIVYNDVGEYLLPSGERGNDLILGTSNGYTKTVNTLQLTVPNATTNGDLLELGYYGELNRTHLQIPLSVEYFFGSKRWQPFIHLGTKWNLFHYEYKTSRVNIESENQEILFDLKEGNNTKDLYYMSVMTGGGLNWNLRPKLSLRTTLGLEGNFLLNNTQSTTTDDYPQNGLFVHFGAYYKF